MNDYLKELLTKKNIINILILAILALAVPLTINLVRQQQILFSRAATESVQLLDNSCTITQNKKVLTCPTVDLKFTAPSDADLKVTQSLVKVAFADATCTYPQACTTDSGQTGVQTCTGVTGDNSSNPQKACGFDQSGAVAPNCSACTTGVTCGDNPPNTNAPASYIWKAYCAKSCTDTAKHTDCPQNTADPNHVNKDTSNWCYQFTDGAKCLQLQFTGTGGSGGGNGTGGTGNATNSCPVSNSCCYHNAQNVLQTCTANGKDPACPKDYQWCYKGYCVNENYNESSNSCPVPGACPTAGQPGTKTTCGTVTYDSCVDDQGVADTSAQFCKNASKFRCSYSKITACKSIDQSNPSNEFIYSCSSCNVSSPSPAAAATPKIVKVWVAENKSDLTNSSLRKEFAYTPGIEQSYTFKDTSLGQKFVFTQFVDDKGVTMDGNNIQIELIGPTPVVSGFSCEVDITPLNNASDLLFKFVGTNFGQTKGSITLSDGTTLSNFDSWTNNQVIARLSNPPVSQTVVGTQYGATLTNSNGQKSAVQNCGVGITQISLGAKLFCRSQRNFDQDNVNLVLVLDKDHTQKSREKVVIDKDGNIGNIKTKLKSGENYIACIQAPLSLRRCSAPFTAVLGTNILSLNLPVGDYNGDGNINSVDGSLLRTQWGPITSSKNCDVNRDGICNSFEWSCMLHDFNTTNQPEP